MSFFQVEVDDNLTIQPLWMGRHGCRTTCNRCHTAINKRIHTRKLCKKCYQKWELTRVRAWKRWARHKRRP